MPWRDMAIDSGLHHDMGCTLDEAAAYIEQQEEERYMLEMERQEREAKELEQLYAQIREN